MTLTPNTKNTDTSPTVNSDQHSSAATSAPKIDSIAAKMGAVHVSKIPEGMAVHGPFGAATLGKYFEARTNSANEPISWGRGQFYATYDRVPGKFSIGFSHARTDEQDQALLKFGCEIERYNDSIVWINVDNDQIPSLESWIKTNFDSQIRFFSPLVANQKTGEVLILTDDIIVGFKSGVSKETIDQIAAQHELSNCRNNEYVPQEFLFRLSNITDIEQVLTVNSLAKNEHVEYVDPSMLGKITQHG